MNHPPPCDRQGGPPPKFASFGQRTQLQFQRRLRCEVDVEGIDWERKSLILNGKPVDFVGRKLVSKE